MPLRCVLLWAMGCGGVAATTVRVQQAPLSAAADAQMVTIPQGSYIAGSTPEERQQAATDYLTTAGSDRAAAQRWFEKEQDRHVAELGAFSLDLAPVTQAQYAEFADATRRTPPTMDEATWKQQGFRQDWATQVERFVWNNGRPPSGREEHPVVLVTWADANAYCQWRGKIVGAERRLPSAAEFEKAARGAHGLMYPWGNSWSADKLNSAVAGPIDTVAVGSFPAGGDWQLLDLAGNVFQWTASPWPGRPQERTVKGSAWDDFAGVGRGASAHGRPMLARHVLVGFRCAGPA